MSHADLRSAVSLNWDVLLLGAIFLMLAVVSLASLPLPSIVCAQDVGVLLDAGWRYYQGQRCHADYISPLGPLFALLPGIFFKLSGPEYASLQLLPVAVTAVIGSWIFALTRGTVPKIVALFGSVAVGLFAGGLFHPGFEHRALTYAVFYNRVGYGLLCISFVAACFPRSRCSDSKRIFLDASLGAALCLMLFLKINFFAAGCFFALLSLLLCRRTANEWVCLFGSAGVVGLIFGFAIGFRFDLMLADLRLALFAREGSTSNLFFYPLRNFQANADYFAVVGLLSVAAALFAFQEPKHRRSAIIALGVLWAAVVVGFGLTLMQSHGDGRCFPTVVVGAMALLAWIGLGEAREFLTYRIVTAGALVMSVMVVWPHVSAYQFLATLRAEQLPGTFNSPALRDWKVSAFNSWGEDFIPMINEGVTLIRNNAEPDGTLQYIDMANNFSFALGMRSPKRAFLWWDDRSTYSAKSHPNIEVFEDTDYLLLPVTRPIQPQPVWSQIYGAYVDEHYEEAARSPNFLLLRRKVKS